jgi:NADH-quinone oxidoreductase subunit L
MNAVLWVLFVPTAAFGLTLGVLPDWLDGHSLSPTLTTSVLGTGLALVGALATYGAWKATNAIAARTPLGAVAAHPGADPAVSEAEALDSHEAAYGDIAAAPGTSPAGRPMDPGRILLGPALYRQAATGFHLDAVYAALFVRPTQAAARLVRFLDRTVVDTYVRGAATAPRLLGAAVRRIQTGNVQTYLGALLAGSLVLAVAAVLVTTLPTGS